MSKKRMFSPQIIDTDAFLDMSSSAQCLYFHLAMRADDDGFVGNPKKILRVVGANEDDLKILLAKRFILGFESGVVVIKHWLIHNLIRADLYQETQYKKEKSLLGLNENGAYTELREGVAELKKIESPDWLKRRKGEFRTENVPQSALRLGKDRLGKDSIYNYNAKTMKICEVMGVKPTETMDRYVVEDYANYSFKALTDTLVQWCKENKKPVTVLRWMNWVRMWAADGRLEKI